MSANLHLIIGLGATGLSCARYLQQQNIPFSVLDTRTTPPNLDIFRQEFPHIKLSLGGWNEKLLHRASTIIISPGMSVNEPAIVKAKERGAHIIGDIELFARAATMPVIAITGTNAKSTVTTLVGKMAEAAGFNTAVQENLGLVERKSSIIKE